MAALTSTSVFQKADVHQLSWRSCQSLWCNLLDHGCMPRPHCGWLHQHAHTEPSRQPAGADYTHECTLQLGHQIYVLQAAQEQVKRLEVDLAAAVDASAAAEGASAGVLRAEVAMLQARNTRVTQDVQSARAKGDEAKRQVSRCCLAQLCRACPCTYP